MELTPKHTLVVYDAATGEIIQIHHFSAMSGAEIPPQSQLEKIALEQAARKHKREPAGMAVLVSSTHSFQPKKVYKVDLAKRQLRAQ